MPSLPSRAPDSARSDTLSEAVYRARDATLGLGAALDYRGVQNQAPEGRANGSMPMHDAVTHLIAEVDGLTHMITELRDYVDTVKRSIGNPEHTKRDEIPF